jgi:acetyl-CoA/propionyl-CoA carboxylase biotin carboxyl carrier protein
VLRKVLIANRGEIAVRIARACKKMGVPSVAVYSDADKDMPHAKAADEAYPIGPPPVHQSYLVQDKLIDVAKRSGADSVHPGYGLLAENAGFAQRVVDEGVDRSPRARHQGDGPQDGGARDHEEGGRAHHPRRDRVRGGP